VDAPSKSMHSDVMVYLEFELEASLMMISILGDAAATVARRRRKSLIVGVGGVMVSKGSCGGDVIGWLDGKMRITLFLEVLRRGTIEPDL
jgi:hypothetical protein